MPTKERGLESRPAHMNGCRMDEYARGVLEPHIYGAKDRVIRLHDGKQAH